MPEIAYLAGYKTAKGTRNPSDLLRILQRLDAELIDIRYHPQSQWPSLWNRSHLRPVFGTKYHSVTEWGNPNHANGQEMIIADFDAGWRIVEGIARPIIVLCACYDSEKCHRSLVGNRLIADRLCAVHELDWSAVNAQQLLF
jgi:hypothetical protein